MSQENVEIVQAAVEAFNRGGVEALRGFAHPEIEFHEPPEQPGPRVARGIDEVIEVWGEFDSAWETHQTEPVEIKAVGEDQVLLVTVEHFVGRDGMEVDAPFAGVVTIRDKKVFRWEAFWERGRAFEAAGLRE